MNTTAIGRAAEEAAAKYLMERGYKLVDRNWRTRWCEIDIIAAKAGIVSFIEVKFRASDKWGAGLEYVTRRKFQQMQFAAEFWLAKHKWSKEVRLAAMELSGDPPLVANFVLDL